MNVTSFNRNQIYLRHPIRSKEHMWQEDSRIQFLLHFDAKSPFLDYCLNTLLSFESFLQIHLHFSNTKKYNRVQIRYISFRVMNLNYINENKATISNLYLFKCNRGTRNFYIFGAMKGFDNHFLVLKEMPSTRMHQVTS